MAVTDGENTKHLSVAAEYVENVLVEGIGVQLLTTAGHECKVTDNEGAVVFDVKAIANNDGFDLFFSSPKFFKKLTATTLTSGVLVIYLA
jgi:hypothetical protein